MLRSQVVCHNSRKPVLNEATFQRGGEELWAYYVINCLRGHGGEEQQRSCERHRWGRRLQPLFRLLVAFIRLSSLYCIHSRLDGKIVQLRVDPAPHWTHRRYWKQPPWIYEYEYDLLELLEGPGAERPVTRPNGFPRPRAVSQAKLAGCH